MKKYLVSTVILAVLAFSPQLFAHGKFININLLGNGAYPLGAELKKDDAAAGIYNPAFFGAGGGLGLDIKFPYGLGVGPSFAFHSFLRKEDTPGQDTTPFNDVQGFLDIIFRVLDIVPSYSKKWGTLIVGVAPGAGGLYREVHVAVKAGLAYLYPVYEMDILTVQVGLGFDFVWQHPFAEGIDDDMYLAFGLRVSLGVMKEPWGERKKKPGETEEEMAEQVTDEMKRSDTDGDGLSDYCELMLGTDKNIKDTDGDGLFDSEEDKNKNCMRDEGETDPAVEDTDEGGAPDGWEIKATYDPLDPDDDDKDQDFITDHQDSCPGTPRGIAVNERGCPTLIEATVLEGVKFEENTAELTAEGQEALENWVNVFMDNPELKFAIVSYTDNKGNKKKLKKLSSQRAEVVFDFFASKGVSESRMTHEGKGHLNPIESNKTKEGREANNRIEIVPELD